MPLSLLGFRVTVHSSIVTYVPMTVHGVSPAQEELVLAIVLEADPAAIG